MITHSLHGFFYDDGVFEGIRATLTGSFVCGSTSTSSTTQPGPSTWLSRYEILKYHPPIYRTRVMGYPIAGKEDMRMARIEESIEINCPVEKTFAYTTNAGYWSTWNTALPEAEQTSEGPTGIGSTFRGTARLMGRSMPWTARATEYEVNKKFDEVYRR